MKSALALCLSALAAASCLTIRAPLRAPLHAPRRATPLMNELQKEVEQRRLFRTVGVGAGVALLSGGLGVGVVAGVLDGNVVGGALSTVGVVGSALFGAYTFSFEESREPYSPVAPAESAPGMGSGLFATADIPKDTYLFDYEGERLTEPEMFERYPDGQGRITWPCGNSRPARLRPSRPPARPWASAGSSAGRPSASASLGQPRPVCRHVLAGRPHRPRSLRRYVACIGVTDYIDGVNEERSGLARWINHSRRRANCYWKKQRFGPSSPAMHFYTLSDIRAGEELFFDYGEAYWEAMGVEPID